MNRIKTVPVSFWFSQDEVHQLESQASSMGITKQELIRLILRGACKFRTTIPPHPLDHSSETTRVRE